MESTDTIDTSAGTENKPQSTANAATDSAPADGTTRFNATPTELGGPIIASASMPFVVSHDWNQDLDDAALPPSWVLEGSPSPRMRFTAMAADGSTASGIWACNPGKFTFIYDFDEWVHIVSGSVVITAGGFSREMRAGSVAFFPRGLTTTWHVHDHIHKFFVQRNPPKLVRIARRLAGKKSPFS